MRPESSGWSRVSRLVGSEFSPTTEETAPAPVTEVPIPKYQSKRRESLRANPPMRLAEAG